MLVAQRIALQLKREWLTLSTRKLQQDLEDNQDS
jgi:hypothetical protein